MASRVMEVLVLENLWFASLGGIRRESSLNPQSRRLLTVILSGRAKAAHPPSPKHGPKPYTRGSNNKFRRGRGAAAPPPAPRQGEVLVDVIFSAHSDGLMAILRKA